MEVLATMGNIDWGVKNFDQRVAEYLRIDAV